MYSSPHRLTSIFSASLLPIGVESLGKLGIGKIKASILAFSSFSLGSSSLSLALTWFPSYFKA